MRCGNMSVRTSILSRYASKLTTRPTISVLRPSYMVGGKNGQGSILSIFPPRCTQNMDGDVSGFANVVGVHQTGNVADHSSTPDKMRRQNSRHSSNNSFTPTVKMVCFFAIAPLLLISHTALVVAATGVLHLVIQTTSWTSPQGLVVLLEHVSHTMCNSVTLLLTLRTDQCQDNTCCSSGTFCCNSRYFGCKNLDSTADHLLCYLPWPSSRLSQWDDLRKENSKYIWL